MTEDTLREELAAKTRECDSLRDTLSRCVSALCNGSVASANCSTDFFALLPDEIAGLLASLRKRVQHLESGIDCYQDAMAGVKPAQRERLRNWELKNGQLDLGLTGNRLALEMAMEKEPR